jgi:hypothetical protein
VLLAGLSASMSICLQNRNSLEKLRYVRLVQNPPTTRNFDGEEIGQSLRQTRAEVSATTRWNHAAHSVAHGYSCHERSS